MSLIPKILSIFYFRELLRKICPTPTKWSKIYKGRNLPSKDYDKLMCDYTTKFAKLTEFVKKNKKCPDFKEDFEKIKKDATLFYFYKSLNATRRKLEYAHYFRNEIFINKIKKPEFQQQGIPNVHTLFDFLDAALKYQEENLVWFTNSEWFNQNSQLIFEYVGKNDELGIDENECLNETTNVIIETDDKKEKFNNYVKPYKSLRYSKE